MIGSNSLLIENKAVRRQGYITNMIKHQPTIEEKVLLTMVRKIKYLREYLKRN